MFGWQDQPTPVELFAYLAYWICVSALGVAMIRTFQAKMARRVAEWRATDEATKAKLAVLEQQHLEVNASEDQDIRNLDGIDIILDDVGDVKADTLDVADALPREQNAQDTDACNGTACVPIQCLRLILTPWSYKAKYAMT